MKPGNKPECLEVSLAKVMDRTKSYVAAEAIRAYVDLNEWQIA